MSAHISPERYIKEFQTDITDCIGFAVENDGTTLLELSFDKGNTWLKVKPDTSRTFDSGVGDVFIGEIYGRFGEVYTYPGEEAQSARNDGMIVKILFTCPNKR